jgi:hypothetical protein
MHVVLNTSNDDGIDPCFFAMPVMYAQSLGWSSSKMIFARLLVLKIT